MYSLLCSFGIALLVGVAYSLLDPWGGWVLGSVLGGVTFLASNFVLSRRTLKKIEPAFQQAQKHAEAGRFEHARKVLRELIPLSRWQFLLESQIHAQLGMLAYSDGDDDEALEHLRQTHARVPDARLFLAALFIRRQQYDDAARAIAEGIKHHKKQSILRNLSAWLQHKQGDVDGAIRTLQEALKVDAEDEASKDNLWRLQNGKKLNMRKFGMTWYALKIERPPASMGQLQGRKGFRQKPQRAGRKRKR